MRLLYLCAAFVILFSISSGVSGCLTRGDPLREFLGSSTRDLESRRKDALSKTFDYDYKTCYKKTEDLLKKMPKTSIYSKNNEMIAVYYMDPNTTPVGVFFKELEPSKTQVEITSPSTDAKRWVAENVFSESVKQPQELNSIKEAQAFR